MAGKTGKIVKLEAIEEQLKRQDKKMTLSLWWSLAATVGIPMMLVGFTLYVQSLDVAEMTGLIIFGLGLAVILGAILVIVKALKL